MYKLLQKLPINNRYTWMDVMDQKNIMSALMLLHHDLIVARVGRLGRPRDYFIRRSSSAKVHERFFWLTYRFATPKNEFDVLQMQSALVEVFELPKVPKMGKGYYSTIGFYAPITTEEGRKQLEEYKWWLTSKLANG